MWTYDGLLIEKKEGKYKVFSDNEKTFGVFTKEYGELHDYFKEQMDKETKDDGLYQCEVGYGGLQDPTIYCMKKIAEVLDWSHLEDTIAQLEHP